MVDSELFINKNYKTIDIVPVLEGAGDDAKDVGLVVVAVYCLGWFSGKYEP